MPAMVSTASVVLAAVVSAPVVSAAVVVGMRSRRSPWARALSWRRLVLREAALRVRRADRQLSLFAVTLLDVNVDV